ncbi:hypothetical protein GCM10028828_06480 [Corynebacterium tapiri]
MPKEDSPEFRVRALQLIEERFRLERQSGWVVYTAVGAALDGISAHTQRNWWKQHRIDHGHTPGVITTEAEDVTRLCRENQQLRRANERDCRLHEALGYRTPAEAESLYSRKRHSVRCVVTTERNPGRFTSRRK